MALEQPKKPVGGAYGAFLTEKRPEFAKACAGQKASAISTMAGEAWKKLSEAEKKPFQEKYELAKANFEKEMAAFLAAGGEKAKGVAALRSEKKKAKSGKKVKDPNQPKKPAGGAYGVFLAENRADIVKSLPEGHKITDVSKAAGEQFKALSEDARQVYHNKYVKKSGEYKVAMAEYKASHPDAEDDDDAEEENEEGNSKASPAKAAPKKATPEKRAVASKASPKKASPKKRAVAGSNPSPPAKRGRAAKASTPAGPEIDAALLAQAGTDGLLSQLRNLASRPDVQTSGKSQKEMLECLKNNGGLVNKAKAALLGGA